MKKTNWVVIVEESLVGFSTTRLDGFSIGSLLPVPKYSFLLRHILHSEYPLFRIYLFSTVYSCPFEQCVFLFFI